MQLDVTFWPVSGPLCAPRLSVPNCRDGPRMLVGLLGVPGQIVISAPIVTIVLARPFISWGACPGLQASLALQCQSRSNLTRIALNTILLGRVRELYPYPRAPVPPRQAGGKRNADDWIAVYGGKDAFGTSDGCFPGR
jgi:hypothetical protein